MFPATKLALVALVAHRSLAVEFVQKPLGSASNAHCETVCEHVQDPNVVISIGSGIENTVSSDGNANVVVGAAGPGGCNRPASIWQIWQTAFASQYPSGISHIAASGTDGDLVCIDKAVLAKLTVAATNCHSQVLGSGAGGAAGGQGGGSFHWQSHWGGSMGPGDIHLPPNTDSGSGSDSASGSTSGNIGNGQGPSPGSGSGSNTGSSVSSGTTGSSVSSGSSGSSTGWGTGGVASDQCFRIKDKQTDRYLTTYGAEYAFARLPGYSSVFRAHASKKEAGAFTLTEIKRNSATVSYPVKLNTGLGQFKPLWGDKDALFTFSPANFGDSCWGVPGKKMSKRSDWGGWGPNYRQSSSGEDCVDVELEEADC